MLRVLEVVEMLRVLDFDASLHLLIPVVDDLKMKSMLQLLIVVMEQQQHVVFAAMLQQEFDSIHGFDTTGSDFQNSHS
jgi:hypothetical protein